MPDYYAVGDIFVLSSFNETWGLVVNEAMNAGCAIIASDQVGSAADLVRDGKNGFVIPAGDVLALGNALQAVLDDYRFRKMGQHSREIIAGWDIGQNVAGLREAL